MEGQRKRHIEKYAYVHRLKNSIVCVQKEIKYIHTLNYFTGTQILNFIHLSYTGLQSNA